MSGAKPGQTITLGRQPNEDPTPKPEPKPEPEHDDES
jgi:hypothetical protein